MLDINTRTPFALEDDFSQRLVRVAYEHQNLQVLASMGFPGTWKVDSVVVCHPFMVTVSELRETVQRLGRAVDVVCAPYLAREAGSRDWECRYLENRPFSYPPFCGVPPSCGELGSTPLAFITLSSFCMRWMIR